MWDTINPRGSSFGGMSRKKRNVKWPWFQQTTRELVFFLTRPCYRNFLDLCDSCEWPIGKQFRDGVFPFRRVFYSNVCPDCFIIRPAWRRRFDDVCLTLVTSGNCERAEDVDKQSIFCCIHYSATLRNCRLVFDPSPWRRNLPAQNCKKKKNFIFCIVLVGCKSFALGRNERKIFSSARYLLQKASPLLFVII